MDRFNELLNIVKRLRAPDGCPWDREQTHSSIKAACIEEAAEVICGINILEETGNADNFKEELGDLLFQVVIHACMAEEEGLFTMDDVVEGISQKMVRRHPHVFGDDSATDSQQVTVKWEEIKKLEKSGKEWTENYLPDAFDEAIQLVNKAKERKGY
ncbi:MAG: MazG family protein [Bacillota bacterium]|nr:MazG family protein [Bacillota bacterium]